MGSRIPRPVPRPFIVLGALWLFVALSLIVSGAFEFLSSASSRESLFVLIPGSLALLGAFGLITGRSYARFLIALFSGVALLLILGVFVPAAWLGFAWHLTPYLVTWWVLALLALFFAWSAFFVLRLWPDFEVPAGAAG